MELRVVPNYNLTMSYFLDIDKVDIKQIAAVDDQENKISYGELINFSNELKDFVNPRSIVFHFSENSVPSLSFYIACMNLKAVPLLLSPQTDVQLIESLLEKYKPNYIIAPERICQNFKGKVLKKSKGYHLIYQHDLMHQLYENLSLLLPTSGSTGSPKLVRHSYENIESSAKSVAELFELNCNHKAFAFLPMYYTMGLSAIHSHLSVGATVVLIQSAITDVKFWNALKQHEPSSLSGVPYSFEILKKLRIFRMKMPNLKFINEGGGKLSPELYDECIHFSIANGAKFIPTYGQTEGTSRMTFLDSKMVVIKKGSIGKAIPRGTLSIINEQGVESFDGEAEGEMIFRGPSVTLGYANQLEDLNLSDERLGVLYTGDMVKRDLDGYYFITGRKSRFLKLFGIRVSLDDVEQIVINEYNVECACGGNDEKMIVLITDKKLEKQISDFICAKTGLFHKAFTVIYVKEIPRNESGKVVFYGKV